MRITRGFLAPYKSACHLVNYKWRQGKWKCAKLVQNKVMEDTDKAGEISPLQYIHAKKNQYWGCTLQQMETTRINLNTYTKSQLPV